MDWKNLITGSLLGAAALRLLLIPDMWLILGFVALILFWIFLSGKVGDKKKYVDLGFMIVFGLVLIATTGLNLYNNYVRPHTKMSSAASTRAILAGDLESALRINPNMLKSRIELASQIQWLQDQIGEQHGREMDGVRRSLLARQITPEDAWKIINKIVQEENDNRSKSKEFISKLSDVRLPSSEKSWHNSFLGKVAILGLLGVALLIVSAIPWIPGRKLTLYVGTLFFGAALLLGATSLFFPQIAAATSEIKAAAGGPPAPTYVPPAPVPVPESGQKAIQVRPDKMSEEARIDYGTCWTLQTQETGQGAAIAVFDASSGRYLFQLSEIDQMALIRGVRFKGPESTLKFKWKKNA